MMPKTFCSTLLGAILLLAGCASTSTGDVAGSPAGLATQQLLHLDREAAVAYAGGRHEIAVEAYETLVRSMDAEPEYWYRLGNSYTRLGRLTEAAMAYEQALAIDPSNARAWHNLGVVLTARAREAHGHGVRLSPGGDPVHEESLRLSRQLAPRASEAGTSGAPSTSSPGEP